MKLKTKFRKISDFGKRAFAERKIESLKRTDSCLLCLISLSCLFFFVSGGVKKYIEPLCQNNHSIAMLIYTICAIILLLTEKIITYLIETHTTINK